MLVLGKYSNGSGSLLSEKWSQNKEITSSSFLQDSQFHGKKKKKKALFHYRAGNEEYFITEMMWEILYVGNVQFPKIEAGQNQFNYLGINIVAFLLTQSGQRRLFKAAEDKCQRGLVQAVESVLPVMPQRQWNCHRITESYLKNYFFRLLEIWKVCLHRCSEFYLNDLIISIMLKSLLIFQISVETWYISFTPFYFFKTILFLMLTVSTLTQILYMKQRNYGSHQSLLSIFSLMWTNSFKKVICCHFLSK